ncbi:hypothetical protein AAVH_05656 [Aphelenchoides avenae]|nr:hypothetical protein AAVH_05656 [Aphelenchus avenae]
MPLILLVGYTELIFVTTLILSTLTLISLAVMVFAIDYVGRPQGVTESCDCGFMTANLAAHLQERYFVTFIDTRLGGPTFRLYVCRDEPFGTIRLRMRANQWFANHTWLQHGPGPIPDGDTPRRLSLQTGSHVFVWFTPRP